MDVNSQRTDWRSWTAPEDAHARGRAMRDEAVHHGHVERPGRPTIAEYVRATSEGRVPELVPLRVRRMLATPFSFFRGAAGLMAHDLAGDPTSGITAQLCGDAHAANIGLFGRKDGEIVIDFNDFDETAPGPWEWDVKRLATSLILAGRVAGVSEKHCRDAVHDTVSMYRKAAAALASRPFLDSWYTLADENTLRRIGSHDLIDELEAAAAKARKNTSAKAAAKWTTGDWHFTTDPPTLTSVDDETADEVVAGLDEYTSTLPESLAALIRRYTVCDVAFRVVGTGSVGLRNYLVLMRGNGDEPLILQVKQAIGSALEPYLKLPPSAHNGERVVRGSRLVQADTDMLLGWTTVAGRDYIVRQFRNRKGKIDPETLSHHDLDDYGRLAGALLARAHARSLDVRVLAGYCEDGEGLDASLVAWAVAYADRTERDWEELGRAVKRGEVEG